MTPGSQFPHSNAHDAALAGNDAAILAHRRETGDWRYDPAREAREEEQRFRETFGEDPFQYTLAERARQWQAHREEHAGA